MYMRVVWCHERNAHAFGSQRNALCEHYTPEHAAQVTVTVSSLEVQWPILGTVHAVYWRRALRGGIGVHMRAVWCHERNTYAFGPQRNALGEHYTPEHAAQVKVTVSSLDVQWPIANSLDSTCYRSSARRRLPATSWRTGQPCARRWGIQSNRPIGSVLSP